MPRRRGTPQGADVGDRPRVRERKQEAQRQARQLLVLIAAGKKGAVRVKLTKKGLRLLRRAKKAKGTVTIRVTKGATVTTKKVTVTLRAPKKH